MDTQLDSRLSILLCGNVPAVAKIKSALELEFGAEVKVKRNFVDARAEIASSDVDFDWLIVWEETPESDLGVVFFETTTHELDANPARQLLEGWTAAAPAARPRRGILISDGFDWCHVPKLFSQRVTAIRQASLRDQTSFLLDMIENASRDDEMWIEPTVISLQLDDDGDEDGGQDQERRLTIACKRIDGPLQHECEELSQMHFDLPAVFPGSDDSRKEWFIQIGRAVQSLFHMLQRANERVSNYYWRNPCEHACLFQIHITCKETHLDTLLDLSLAAGSSEPLCDFAPVLWHVETHSTTRRYGSRGNVVSHEGVETCRILYSFANSSDKWRLAAIEGVREHCQKIADQIRLNGTHVVEVRQRDEVRDQLPANQSGVDGAHAYIIAHGRHVPEHSDESGVWVGPRAETDDCDVVAPNHLQPRTPYRLRFAFFNCCELGEHKSEHHSSFFGGFAHGVLACGVAEEVICNRWRVDQRVAKAVAERFYSCRRRTVFARSLALLRARKEEVALQASCLSRYAPFHLRAVPLSRSRIERKRPV